MDNNPLDHSYPVARTLASSPRIARSSSPGPAAPALAPLGSSPRPESLAPDPGLPAPKRHYSMSAYANSPSSKRCHNPLQAQLPLHSSAPATQNYASTASAARLNSAPARRSVRRGSQFASPLALQAPLHSKTPTPPSAYDVPASPNGTAASAHNNSDLSASSPAVDQGSAGQQGQQAPLLHRLSMLLPPAASTQQRAMSEEEQQLANKLKETYKNIVNFEEVVQKGCVDLTVKISHRNLAGASPLVYVQAFPEPMPLAATSASTTELSNDLWTIYHHNITLLNNYHDFLITALKPTANTTQFKTGRNIVDLYKIPRRMWVYGIVGYLEVLKNMMSIFQDHEIFLCFIAYCFSVVSNLTDPALEMEGWWCEKLGDLSRMAIALYSSRFIDWKISAEYWYAVSMKTMYGHGKIYYHMCTVQQDNLDALVNIGKSVNCRDPFVPTQQYLRLVVENICTQRNILSLLELPIIDFIKIHKVLMSIYPGQNRLSPSSGGSLPMENIHDAQLQYGIDLVTRYGITFGCDSQGYNFFTRTFCLPGGLQTRFGADPFNLFLQQQQQQQDHDQNSNSLDSIEKMNFWFNKGALFAISNINHLIGFGDPRNPFAKLFQLPEALRERKDKKERKKRSKSQSIPEDGSGGIPPLLNANISGTDSQLLLASELSAIDWFLCLSHINKSVLELSFRILNYYLIGPKQASTCHVIVWLYFLIAVGEASKIIPTSRNMFLWLFRKFFPWEALINYLNTLVAVATNNSELNTICREYLVHHSDYIEYFNQLEFLPEVWKCWGSLWFDVISPKQDYSDLESAGILNHDLFDIPHCGTSPSINIANQELQERSKKKDNQELDNDKRLVRIILLARYLADGFDFGLVRTADGFKFDRQIYKETESNDLVRSAAPENAAEIFQFIRDVFYSDGRLTQNDFITPISPENIVDIAEATTLNSQEKDEQWFGFDYEELLPHHGDGFYVERRQVDEDMEGYSHSEMEEDPSDSNQHSRTRALSNDLHTSLHHHDDPENVLIHGNEPGNFDEFYSSINPQYLSPMNRADLQFEGDLGDRMDTGLTYITLDTNIWLKHCGKIFKCVRSKVIKVLIPLIVFQELRSLRKSAEATIADAATRSVIIIRELYYAKDILPLRFDGTVASDINETAEFENNANWMSNVDLTMLNVVNEHDEISKRLFKGLNVKIHGPKPLTLDSKSAKLFRYCILITDDRNMRLRAKTSGLTSFQSKWLFGQLESLCSDKCID
ncbi:hypothetical protein METBIDRAFT_30042 [Metschnikowia bicuspidata var. bicuspidata NRRL YB-4993]|uniref:PIN domain-containing protein n=1 Tax=Metschnikowia bicuspidata var. bicuspidata NRRL YB-4993 TaxID=869754 RepID=A0A1A0HHG4_9ASCO|nr:hypothetical protein METBIDRAFT_30042 [Metschnikowia bicuspidata var. bicuspidata NRRL YB-4993]OBA23604.1 hypothetical protein METBIDRAFT_30042 [Metschnikowia bicuspidata var. bicuspidata NRRL YB-4993]